MDNTIRQALSGEEARSRAVWLEITSWRGTSFGAVHYYGALCINHGCSKFPCGCTREYTVDLKRKLTASQAKELTKLQNDNSLLGVGYRWQAGAETKCFDSKEDIVLMATRVYQEVFPDKTLLLLGSNVYVYPDAILHDATGAYAVEEVGEPK